MRPPAWLRPEWALPAAWIGAVTTIGAACLTSNDYVLSVMTSIATYVVLGLGLNIVVGFAGLLDLGYSAFFAIGAYTSAILTTNFGVDFWLSLVPSVGAAGLAGLLLGYPTLRLRSDYLAIVTLGFGEIVRISFNNWDYVNGPDGIRNVPPPSLFGHVFDSQSAFLVLITLLAAAAWVFTYNLSRSRIARGWRALREDEACAGAIGIPTLRLKLSAYVCGGMWGGVAGAFFASRIGLISPMSFTYQVSFIVLNLVIIGGIGSLPGVLLGSIVVIGFPEILRDIDQYRLLGFSVALIVLVLVRPAGLWPHREPKPPEPRLSLQPPRCGNVSPGRPLLQVRSLVKRFGGVKAIADVSFAVEEGEIFSLIGPNGAGKTTVLNCISGVLPGAEGAIVFAGTNLLGKPPHEVAAAGIARTFQGVRLFRPLSVLENVMTGCYLWQQASVLQCALRLHSTVAEDRDAMNVADAAMAFVGVKELRSSLADTLAYANQRRVEIARALAAKPRMLLLDEPAAGMNPTETTELARLLLAIRDAGYTILVIEHDMSLVMSISNRVAVMAEGQLIALGPPQEVQANSRVIDAYLGRDRTEPAMSC